MFCASGPTIRTLWSLELWLFLKESCFNYSDFAPIEYSLDLLLESRLLGSSSLRTKSFVRASNQVFVWNEGDCVISWITTTSDTGIRNFSNRSFMLNQNIYREVRDNIWNTVFKNMNKIEIAPFLSDMLLLIGIGQTENSQLGISPVGSRRQDVRQKHGESTVIVQPPNVNGSALLFHTETADAVLHFGR